MEVYCSRARGELLKENQNLIESMMSHPIRVYIYTPLDPSATLKSVNFGPNFCSVGGATGAPI